MLVPDSRRRAAGGRRSPAGILYGWSSAPPPHRVGAGGASCDPLTGSADSFAYRLGHAWAQGAVEV